MHPNQQLILTIFPRLQSTPLLQTPLLAGQIASSITLLKEPVDGFFTNPKGLVVPFQTCPSRFGERLDHQATLPQTEQTESHPFACLRLDTHLQGFMNHLLVASLQIPLLCIWAARYRKRFSIKIFSDATQASLHRCNFFSIISQYFHYILRRHQYGHYQWNYQNKVWSTAVFPQLPENRGKLLYTHNCFSSVIFWRENIGGEDSTTWHSLMLS